MGGRRAQSGRRLPARPAHLRAICRSLAACHRARDGGRRAAQPQNQIRRVPYADQPTWANTEVLAGDAVKAVAALAETDGGEIHVIGSAELARTLLAHDLIDELHVMVDPVLVGGGKRLFPDDGTLRSLTLTRSETTSTGAMLLTYARTRP